MACFVAPAVVAVATTVAHKALKTNDKSAAGEHGRKLSAKWSQRLGWLNTMLWTATILSVVEHVIRGEVTAYPPFFTALQTPGQLGPMLREIATNGVVMTVAVAVVWAMVVAIAGQRDRARNLAKLQAEAID
jgi:hypothetical protein